MHIGLENDYNQIHPHARCEMPNDILYGAYYNSEDQVSLYFGKTLDNVERGWDMEYGLTTGYSGYLCTNVAICSRRWYFSCTLLMNTKKKTTVS